MPPACPADPVNGPTRQSHPLPAPAPWVRAAVVPRVLLLAAALMWGGRLPVRGVDADPPTVVSVVPSPGVPVGSLDQVRVTFSEPVTGVQAGDFLVNELPAFAVEGGSNTWTFLFTQPGPGEVRLRWDLNAILSDLAGNRLDPKGVGASWSYLLADLLPPVPLSIQPTPGATLAGLDAVEVLFNEPVSGVQPASLLINGTAASSVTGDGAGPYRFSFPAAQGPAVSLAWSSSAQIRDLAPAANALAAPGWSYLLDPATRSADVVINEILAENLNGLTDEDGATPDWIELLNRGGIPVNLLGWSLSDDPAVPGKWIFPSITLPPGGYLVVYASGKNRTSTAPGARLHTNFRLAGTGGSLALFDPGLPARTADLLSNYPPQRGDIPYGRAGAGEFAYLGAATPGGPNSAARVYSGFVEPPRPSVASGFFDTPFSVAFDSPTPGATLYYTLDGSVPTRDSLLYSGPIQIAGTESRAVVTVRVAGFEPGRLPSLVTTMTYIFPVLVLSQPANPAGFPATWVSPGKLNTPGDYAMDPKITQDPVYRPLALQGLTSLPTLSLVTDEKLLFEPAQGVYVRRDSANRQPAHIEMIHPDGTPGFSLDCGFEIQGGSSPTDSGNDWKDKNLSMRLVFSGDFGNTKLKYPLYPGGPVDEFDTLILDSALNMVWNHMTDADQRYRGQYAREQFVNELMIRTTAQPPRGRFVLLYVNGLYWGMKDLHERPEEKWAATYFGGDPADYDVMKHDSSTVIAGNAAAYNAMLAAVRKPQGNITNYVATLQHLDLDWFIDYMMVNYWAGNTDWDNHNWYAIRSRRPGAPGWRFISWDAEHTLKSVTEDVSAILNSGAGSEIFTSLRGSPEFRLRCADHIQRHFFNDGIFYTDPQHPEWDPAHPEWNRPAALYMEVINTIDPAIVCESARWGDVARPGQPYTRNVEWLHELQSLLFLTNSPGNTTRYFPLRSSNVFVQFKRLGLYPTNSLPPTFSQHGGRVPPGYALTMASNGPGTIYYTTDGADPRLFRSGAPSPAALPYSPEAPPLLNGSTLVKARTLNGTNWSALLEARFEAGLPEPPLRITEIMYNPPGGDAFEFLELQNTSPAELDLGGWSVDGIGMTFVPGTRLPSGAFLVLAPGVDTNAWKLRYPGVRIGGIYTGTLGNGGERLALVSPDGITRYSVTYNNKGGWPDRAAGGGSSLELVDPSGDPSDPSSWRASPAAKGSPGAPNLPVPPAALRISEVLAENGGSVPHEGTLPDFVELENRGADGIDLSGWSLSDNGNPRRFVLPAGSRISAGGFLVIWCDTNSTSGLHAGFGLDRQGDSLFLYDPLTNRVDALSWGPQLTDLSLGRVGDDFTLTTPTPGAVNAAARLAEPSALWVNELMADPVPGQEDWIELYNRDAGLPVALRNLSFRVGDRTVRYSLPGFLPPLGFVQLIADERPGFRHLDFRLPASALGLTLMSPSGTELQGVAFPVPGTQGVSFGSYPDGTPGAPVAFYGNPTPGAPNASPAPYSGPQFHEILARNESAVLSTAGTFSDFVEIVNPLGIPLSLDGCRLEVDGGAGGRFLFPAGLTLEPQGLLVLWCDASIPASTAPGPSLFTGFSLPGNGATLTLRDRSEAVLSLEYGFQIANFPVGVVGPAAAGEWGLLAVPTPGNGNSPAAQVGSPALLRINEWMADPEQGADWFELYNGDPLPVRLDGIALAGQPSLAGSAGAGVFRSLNFIAGHGHAVLVADGDPLAGQDHVPFRLGAEGDSIRLYDRRLPQADGTPVPVIDSVTFGAQAPGVSAGRWPDGGDSIRRFPGLSSPGSPNRSPLASVRISEVLSSATAVGGDFIELLNTTTNPVDLSGWGLTDDPADPLRYRFPVGTLLAPGGYLRVGESLFSTPGAPGVNRPFSLAASGETVVLSEVNPGGELTGRQDEAELGPAGPNISQGLLETCLGDQFVPLLLPTPGGPNAAPRVGPVVLNEILSGSPSDPASDLTAEYIELLNTSTTTPVALGDPAIPWRIAGAIDFRFPPTTLLPPGGYLLVVPFDPSADPASAAGFRARHSVDASVPIVGPYSGRFHGTVAPLRLERLTVTGLPFDRVDSLESVLPFPAATVFLRKPALPGQDPAAWVPGTPSPGRVNALPDPGTPPLILAQPLGPQISLGTPVQLGVTLSGSDPLQYQWLHDGVAIPGATSASLSLEEPGPMDAGNYSVRVWNLAGCTLSREARVFVPVPPQVLTPPQSQMVDVGKSATLSVVTLPSDRFLTYQWLFNGEEIPGATASSLTVPNAQLVNEGNYSVRISDGLSTRTTAEVRLTVKVRPVIVQQPTPALQTVAIGSNATLTVSATGSLPMGFTWRRLKGTVNTLVTNVLLYSPSCTLTLPSVRTNDAGKYWVVITNLAGGTLPANSFTSVVSVVQGPSLLRQPASTTVVPGASATFTVEAAGDAPLGYQWMRNGLPLAGANAPSFTLPSVTASDAGAYSVAVTNPGATVVSEAARLLVLSPLQLDISLEGGSILLRWSGTPGQTYRIETTHDLQAGEWVAAGAEQSLSTTTGGLLSQPWESRAVASYYRLVLVNP